MAEKWTPPPMPAAIAARERAEVLFKPFEPRRAWYPYQGCSQRQLEGIKRFQARILRELGPPVPPSPQPAREGLRDIRRVTTAAAGAGRLFVIEGGKHASD